MFQDDVDSFMAQSENDNSADKVLRRLDEQHSKYKLMEYNISARRRKLKIQIPDLAKSLEMIDILREQTEDKETQFLLSEQVFLKTNIAPTKTVCLWLGANVMLEYPLDEAEVLLKQNMESAEQNLKCLEHDQDFLRYLFIQFIVTMHNLPLNVLFFIRLLLLQFYRDQLTTTEVNMARVYNWDVKRRQAAGSASGKK